MRRILVMTCIALALLCACARRPGSGNSAGGNRTLHSHVLRYATGEDFETLNPLLTAQTTTMLMASLTMAWLVKADRNGRPMPELLTTLPTKRNGGVSKDGKTITYHLRRGVKWSDGAPFTADDVVFSIHEVLNPNNDVVSRSGWDRIERVDEPDKYTVVLHLRKPYSPFLETFFSSMGANPAIMPKHLLSGYSNLNHVPYNSLPVGIGPFKYKAWERGERVVMVANPLYFRGRPKLHEIDFEIIPNANTVLTEMQSHQLDLWYGVTGEYVNELRGDPDLQVLIQPNYFFHHIDFNLKSPLLRDRAVRIALRLATDRPRIIRKIYHGVGILEEQPAPRISTYWDPAIRLVPFNVPKANAILDAAGWKRGPDGIRRKGHLKLVLDFATVSGDPTTDQVLEQLRADWGKIGVGIRVHHYVPSLLFAPMQDGGILDSGKFDVTYFSWGTGITGDFSDIYRCDQVPPQGQNILHWCNRRADAAMHKLLHDYSPKRRRAEDAIVMKELDRDVPTIIVAGTKLVWVYNRRLKGFHPGPIAPFDQMLKVDI